MSAPQDRLSAHQQPFPRPILPQPVSMQQAPISDPTTSAMPPNQGTLHSNRLNMEPTDCMKRPPANQDVGAAYAVAEAALQHLSNLNRKRANDLLFQDPLYKYLLDQMTRIGYKNQSLEKDLYDVKVACGKELADIRTCLDTAIRGIDETTGATDTISGSEDAEKKEQIEQLFKLAQGLTNQASSDISKKLDRIEQVLVPPYTVPGGLLPTQVSQVAQSPQPVQVEHVPGIGAATVQPSQQETITISSDAAHAEDGPEVTKERTNNKSKTSKAKAKRSRGDPAQKKMTRSQAAALSSSAQQDA